MKLILTDEIDGLGAAGDIVEVKDGYGRNYLVPHGLATRWTKGAEKQVATIRRVRDAREIRTVAGAAAAKTNLESLRVGIAVRAGEGGRLFGAVTSADVVAAIAASGGPTLDKRSVVMGDTIKNTGEHTVTVKLLADTTADVLLDIVAS